MSSLNIIMVDGALTGNRLADASNGSIKDGSGISLKPISSDVDHSDSDDEKDEEGAVGGLELQGGMLTMKGLIRCVLWN